MIPTDTLLKNIIQLSWVAIIFYAFIGVAFLSISFGEKNKISNRYLGFFCFSMVVAYIGFTLIANRDSDVIGKLAPLLSTSAWLFPFFAFCWLDALLTKDFKPLRFHYMFLIFPAINLAYVFLFLFSDKFQIPQYFFSEINFARVSFKAMLAHFQMSAVIGTIFLSNKYKYMSRSLDMLTEGTGASKWIKYAGIAVILPVTILHTPLLFTESLLYKAATPLFPLPFFLFLIISALKYPMIFNDMLILGEISQKKCTIEKGSAYDLDMMKWSNNLNKLMIEKELYLDKELNASKLAKQLNIKVYQLTILLNQYRKKNLNEYINTFRINKAKEELKKNAHMIKTIEAVGLDVGFKSKSTFYSAFKKITGITPTTYLQNKEEKDIKQEEIKMNS